MVEGVDDYWILTELSRLLHRFCESWLPDDVLITPAGGASEAAYIATFMTSQKLDVVVLLDSDRAGDEARDVLVKRWIVRYQTSRTHVLSLGAAALPQKAFLPQKSGGCLKNVVLRSGATSSYLASGSVYS